MGRKGRRHHRRPHGNGVRHPATVVEEVEEETTKVATASKIRAATAVSATTVKASTTHKQEKLVPEVEEVAVAETAGGLTTSTPSKSNNNNSNKVEKASFASSSSSSPTCVMDVVPLITAAEDNASGGDDSVEYYSQSVTVLEDTDQQRHQHRHHKHSQKNYMMQSQQHFLKKQYREALEYGNLFFENAAANLQSRKKKEDSINEKDVVRLTPTILIPPRPQHPTTTGWTHQRRSMNGDKKREYSFAVSLSCDDYTAASSSSSSSDDFDSDPDQMASIVLQSWHELSKKEQEQQLKAQQQELPLPLERTTHHHNEEKKEVEDITGIMTQGSIARQQRLDRERSWMFLMPMLDYYNCCSSNSKSHDQISTNNTISLDLFLVWIPFWESHQQSQHAFEWTVQVLRRYYCFFDATTSRQQNKLIELLWLHCIGNQLPYVKATVDDGVVKTSPIEELIISITRAHQSNVNTTISATPHQQTMLTMNTSMMTQVDPLSVQEIIDTLDVLLCSITSASSSKDHHQHQQQQPKTMITKKAIERAHRWVSELTDTRTNSTNDTKSATKSQSQKKSKQQETSTSTAKRGEGKRSIKRRKSVTFASDNNAENTTYHSDADTATETRTDCNIDVQSTPASSSRNDNDPNVDGATGSGGTTQHGLVVSRREQFEVYCRNVVDWIQRLFLQFVLKIKIATASLTPSSLSSFVLPSDLLQQGLRAILGDGAFSVQRDGSSIATATRSISTATTMISTSLQSFVSMIKENQQIRQRVAFIVLMVLLSMKKSNRRRARQVATTAAKSVATTVILAPIREVIDALGLSTPS